MGTFNIRPIEQQDVIDAQIVSDSISRDTIANQAKFVASGTINKQDDANVFKTVVGNEYKMANTDRFVNFDGNIVDTYGEELVTNGDFSNGTTGWVAGDSAILSVSNGELEIKNGASYFGYAKTTISCVVGKAYIINVYGRNGTSQPNIFFASGATTIESEIAGTGIFSYAIFRATSSSVVVNLSISSNVVGSTVYYSNISVKEITTVDMTNDIPEVTVQDQATDGLVVQSSVNAGDYVVIDKEELITNGTFDTDTSGWSASNATLSVDTTRMKITNAATNYGYAYQLLSGLTIGAEYYFKADFTFNSNGALWLGTLLGTSNIYNSGTLTADKEVRTSFVATATTLYVTAINTLNTDALFILVDNISVQLKSDIYRAKQTAPASTILTDTTYYEDRTKFGITNKILATRRNDGTIKTEVCFVDTDIEDCGNAHIVMTDNGYSKLSNGLYSKGTDIVTPIGTWSTLNKGAYHPYFNAFGTALWAYDKVLNNGAYWYSNLVSTPSESVADCFIWKTTQTNRDGSIGNVVDSLFGHPQGKYYDIIYPDQWIDLRIEANAVSEQDELNRVSTKAKSGQLDGIGGVVATYDAFVSTLATGTFSGYIAPYTFVIVSGVYNNGNAFGSTDGSTSNEYIKINIDGVNYDSIASSIYGTNRTLVRLDSKYGDISATFAESLPAIGSYHKTLPHPSSGTYLRTDWIGDPSNYPQAVKDRLASGLPMIGMNPLLVDDSGNSLVDSNTIDVKMSGKCKEMLVNLQDIGGGVLQPQSLAFDSVLNEDYTNTNVLTIKQYTAKIPTTQVSDPKAVKLVGNYATATNSHSIYKGNQLVPTGKVNVGNGSNGLESKVVENVVYIKPKLICNAGDTHTMNTGDIFEIYGFSGYADGSLYERIVSTSYTGIFNDGVSWNNTVNYRYLGKQLNLPSHSTMALDNSDSPAYKMIETIAEDDDGMAHYQVFAQEMVSNSGAYDGDDNTFSQLTNGTLTDDNANTVKTIVASTPLNKYIGDK